MGQLKRQLRALIGPFASIYYFRIENRFSNWVFVLTVFGHRYGGCLGIDVAWHDDVYPMLVAMPFKLLLFVLVDGWTMTVGSLVATYVVSAFC